MHINMNWDRLRIISMWFWCLIYVGMIRAKYKEFWYYKENMGLLKNYIEIIMLKSWKICLEVEDDLISIWSLNFGKLGFYP